jgi:hypothetical protein
MIIQIVHPLMLLIVLLCLSLAALKIEFARISPGWLGLALAVLDQLLVLLGGR